MPLTEEHSSDAALIADVALPVGVSLLGDQFTITGHLGAGGFGITYHAKDNVLGRPVVIKECFPEDVCGRRGRSVVARSKSYVKPMRTIVEMFMREARSLAKLRHPNIVGVHRAFEENETAYMVLDQIEGRDLFDILEDPKARLSPARVQDILLQLLNAVEEVHALGLLHRDISPDNILIEPTGTPVLIDFGAARAESSRHTRAVSSFLVVKDGYSPQEFYVAGSEQSPSSDLYALAATFYHVVTGQAPLNSQQRMMQVASGRPDPVVPLAGRIHGYDEAFLQAIDQAMCIHPDDRLQSAAKWRAMISAAVADSGDLSRTKGHAEVPMDLELSLSQLVEETNVEVRKSSKIPTEAEEQVDPVDNVSETPAWVKEFNETSIGSASSGRRQSWPLSVVGSDGWDAWVDTPAPKTPGRSATPSDTDWVERALDKQERIRSDRELQSSAQGTVASDSSDPEVASQTLDALPDVQPPSYDVNSRPTVPRFGIVLGLIVSFGLIALVNAIDGSGADKDAKPIAGGFEMRGSIIN